MACSRTYMAETVIVRECKYGQVRVLFGNILRVDGDLLVTTANNRLAGREGLDEKIHQKAGPELREFTHQIAVERRKENLQPCGVGEAVTTPGFNLPFENLVHVVGPDFINRLEWAKIVATVFCLDENKINSANSS